MYDWACLKTQSVLIYFIVPLFYLKSLFWFGISTHKSQTQVFQEIFFDMPGAQFLEKVNLSLFHLCLVTYLKKKSILIYFTLQFKNQNLWSVPCNPAILAILSELWFSYCLFIWENFQHLKKVNWWHHKNCLFPESFWKSKFCRESFEQGHHQI